MRMGFWRLHPGALLLYYGILMLLAGFLREPVFLLWGVLFVVAFHLLQDGGTLLARQGRWYIWLVVIITLLNPIFSQRGRTVLFTAFDRPFTLEATLYGLANGLSLLLIIMLFASFHLAVSGDGLLTLFGHIAPKSSLVTAIALGFVPRLAQRSAAIRAARRGRGEVGGRSLQTRLGYGAEDIWALLAWSLEDGAKTALAMRARGYNVCPKRSRFAHHQWGHSEWIFCLATLSLCLLLWWSWQQCGHLFTNYPLYQHGFTSGWGQICLGSYMLLWALPLAICGWAELGLRRHIKRRCQHAGTDRL